MPHAQHPAAANHSASANHSLSTTLSLTVESIRGDTVTLRALMQAIGEHGLLMLCAIATLPFLIPVSIPGVSTVFGAAIVLLSVAVSLNRLPWLPQRLLDRQLDAAKLVPALRKGIQLVSKLDRWVRPRMSLLTAGHMERINGLTLIFAGLLLMMPFSFVPFSNTIPAVAILLLTAGMLQRDGLFVLLGYLATLLTVVYFSVLLYAAWRTGSLLFN